MICEAEIYLIMILFQNISDLDFECSQVEDRSILPFWLKIDPLSQKLRAWVQNPFAHPILRVLAMSRRSGAGNTGYGSYGRGGSSGGGQWGGQRSGPNMAHNPYVVQMPKFIEPIAEGPEPEDQSMIVIDSRDDRMVSPFQTWLVSEIMANAASSINVLTERDQVMPPNSGFHLALFGNYTLDGIKVVVAVSIESLTGNTCGGWDASTARALSHPAFQPFSWPMLRDTSASYMDVKIYNGNEILFHWIFRGFRSDTDLTVQQQFVDEFFVREASKGQPRLSIVVAVFIGWRVSVLSFECGGRTYSIGPQGSVVAGDSARSRFELRVCSRSSDDAVGNDADRIEMRFRDANNRIDLKCSRTSVPGTWLTVSHISGPTLIQTIKSVRENKARVEGPEQTEQFAQLAAVHENWWKSSVAGSEEEVGVKVNFVDCLEAGNFHVQARSKLMERAPEIVPQRALAEMRHTASAPAPVGPPALTAQAWLQTDVGGDAQPAPQGEDLLALNRQPGIELNERSFNVRHSNQGEAGHQVDVDRDRARMDRRFARSTAGLTPMIFAEEMQRRSYNTSTAMIEEVEEGGGPQQPIGARTRHAQGAHPGTAGGSSAPVSYGPSTYDA